MRGYSAAPQVTYHVHRNEEVIGTYDETTLHALLTSGKLRLTDTYSVKGRADFGSLADLLGRRNQRRVVLVSLAMGLLLVAGVIALLGLAKSRTHQVRMIEAAGSRDEPAEEIHRGYPVLRSTIIASSHPAPQDFPFQKVENRVVRGRVAVLALDRKGLPMGFGSGFVTEDGMHVVSTLPIVKGASEVQIWFDSRTQVPVRNAIQGDGSGLVILELGEPKVGLLWSRAAMKDRQEVFVVGHALQPLPMVAQIQKAGGTDKRPVFKLDGSLPSAYLGSAVVTAVGEVCGIVSRPETGELLTAEDIRDVQSVGKPRSILTSANHTDHAAVSAPITVDSASILDGELVMQLRNTSRSTINHAVLYVRYHDLPSEAVETDKLERELTSLAVEVCNLELEQPESELCLLKKSQLRQVTAKLETQRQKVSTAMEAARERVYRTDVLAINAMLPPEIPQRVTLATNAASSWGAAVMVLDAEE